MSENPFVIFLAVLAALIVAYILIKACPLDAAIRDAEV